MKIRLYLVDDEPIVRRGLRSFSEVSQLTVCGEAETEHEDLEGILARSLTWRSVDLSLKLGDDLAFIKALHRLVLRLGYWSSPCTIRHILLRPLSPRARMVM